MVVMMALGVVVILVWLIWAVALGLVLGVVCLRLIAILLLVILVLAPRRWPLTYRKEGHMGRFAPTKRTQYKN